MSVLPVLSPEMFGVFFKALWGFDPFPWQQDFANCLCAGKAPDYVTVPTGSGKTACLDAAVFALAVQSAQPFAKRTVGRRIFFIVNRRIIVDEAYDRAQKLALKLEASHKEGSDPSGIIAKVAVCLRYLAGEQSGGGQVEAPLLCVQLRGGIFRDRAWAKSIIQPMILCSTVDQAGSRLLFRGYGVSNEARPIHAALVSQDSLLLIDEAHISQPFLQTLDWVKLYRVCQPNGTEPVSLPFGIVRMTATPPKNEKATMLELSDKDRAHPVLKQRLVASKPVRLVLAAKAKGKAAIEELVKVLETEASRIIAQNPQARSVAVMVNRVRTARDLAKLLIKKHSAANVTLLIGRMRPLDRDEVTGELQSYLKTGGERKTDSQLQIVVSTQCLEVGADFDFDVLISECASLDALRQRFGRLNRGGRPISAQGVIVLPEERNIEENKLNDDKLDDPIYGNAIPRTWRWLKDQAVNDTVDFGLNSMTMAVNAAREANDEAFSHLLMPRASAPVLLPAYLDCWVQTNPSPAADPEISLFLHGPQRDMAEVQVCWRADLPEDAGQWPEILALCPPTNLECLPVPLHFMRQWLEKGDNSEDITGDAPAATEEEEADYRKKDRSLKKTGLIWKGEESAIIQSAATLRPGQTIVLRAQDGGWETLGHLPVKDSTDPKCIDLGDEGQAKLKRRAIVRLHPNIFWPDGDTYAGQLKGWVTNAEFDWNSPEVRTVLKSVAECNTDKASLKERLCFIAQTKRFDVEPYPDRSGVVLTARALLPPITGTADEPNDDGPGDPLLLRPHKQTLEAHTSQVGKLAVKYAAALGLMNYNEAIACAAKLHDIGKADPRFQALLLQSSVSAAFSQPVLWAKSDNIPSSTAAYEKARERATLPKFFRHEMLSVHLADLPEARSKLPLDVLSAALVLHLIASHHGHGRPFAPVVVDEEPPSIEFNVDELKLILSSEARKKAPAHSIDSGIAERFWLLTRHHGWWGLAMLEAVLRLADQTASAKPETPTV
ncbi:type I-U CRISPR-associated helicase/endonuclease Cas3 [Prosthecobacter sp.]|uniref:type I-G CRISPR-associated helicase/endonuclease Cas3g n=1 Tax=Prosthecobacter sp. TaxID=1965333 RepID=UPI003784EC12